MAMLEVTDEQIVALINQLPVDRRQYVLSLLAATPSGQEARGNDLEQRLARVAAERGIDWAALTEEQQEDFIDDLVHEVRRERSR